MIVFLHFCIFAAVEPKIEQTRMQYIWVRVKYCGCWLPFLCVVCVCQVTSFLAAFSASQFNTLWIETLMKFDQAYACTYDSLWVNTEVLSAREQTGTASQHTF